VASKYLFDDGEDEEVYNDEWAASASLEVKELNKREREFLAALDWELFVSPDEFFAQLTVIEIMATINQTRKRGSDGLTYNELVSLGFNSASLKRWLQLYDNFLKIIMVSFVTYSAIVITVFGVTILACSFHVMVSKSASSPNSCTHGNDTDEIENRFPRQYTESNSNEILPIIFVESNSPYKSKKSFKNRSYPVLTQLFDNSRTAIFGY